MKLEFISLQVPVLSSSWPHKVAKTFYNIEGVLKQSWCKKNGSLSETCLLIIFFFSFDVKSVSSKFFTYLRMGGMMGTSFKWQKPWIPIGEIYLRSNHRITIYVRFSPTNEKYTFFWDSLYLFAQIIERIGWPFEILTNFNWNSWRYSNFTTNNEFQQKSSTWYSSQLPLSRSCQENNLSTYSRLQVWPRSSKWLTPSMNQ